MDTPRRRRRDREAPNQSREISGCPTNPFGGNPGGLWIITTEPTYHDIARRAYELYQTTRLYRRRGLARLVSGRKRAETNTRARRDGC